MQSKDAGLIPARRSQKQGPRVTETFKEILSFVFLFISAGYWIMGPPRTCMAINQRSNVTMSCATGSYRKCSLSCVLKIRHAGKLVSWKM